MIKLELHSWKLAGLTDENQRKKLLQSSESGPLEKKSSRATPRSRCSVITNLPKFYTVQAIIFGFLVQKLGIKERKNQQN
jgi:hypothetical protein